MVEPEQGGKAEVLEGGYPRGEKYEPSASRKLEVVKMRRCDVPKRSNKNYVGSHRMDVSSIRYFIFVKLDEALFPGTFPRPAGQTPPWCVKHWG